MKCRSGKVAEMRMWFDRAVAAQFDYIRAYVNLFWALRPRWHGSIEQLYAFADECLATKRYDTEVPDQIWMIFEGIAADEEGLAKHFAKRRNYEMLKQLVEGISAEPGRKDDHAYWRTLLLIASSWTDRTEEAEKLLAELPQGLDAKACERAKVDPSQIVAKLREGNGKK
ncbi:MAG: hypothetical protein R3F30_04475 [Planctomycetota bacterium]